MQTSFDFARKRPSDVQAAIDTLSEAAPGERGAVFTRRAVEAERSVCDQAAFDLYDLAPADRELIHSTVYKDER
ncbi:hypothetical protein [Rhodocaloribacter sp.]